MSTVEPIIQWFIMKYMNNFVEFCLWLFVPIIGYTWLYLYFPSASKVHTDTSTGGLPRLAPDRLGEKLRVTCDLWELVPRRPVVQFKERENFQPNCFLFWCFVVFFFSHLWYDIVYRMKKTRCIRSNQVQPKQKDKEWFKLVTYWHLLAFRHFPK